MSAAPSPRTTRRGIWDLLLLRSLGLNVCFTLAFVLLATGGRPPLEAALLVVLAFVGARNAGHAFNQVVDVRYDAANPRTRARPLVQGSLTPRVAQLVIVLNLALFLGAAYLLDPWLVLLAAPALALVLGYSYTKRVTAATTFFLGAVEALVPAGVYLALRGTVPVEALPALVGMFLFGTAFETVHSLGDLDEDRAQGLRSLPLALGPGRSEAAAALLLGASLASFALYGTWVLGPSLVYLGGLGAALVLGAYLLRGLAENPASVRRTFQGFMALSAIYLATVVGALLFAAR